MVDVFLVSTIKPLDDTPEEGANFLFKTFPNMPASKNRRAISFAYASTDPGGWRGATAVEMFARRLHPDAFAGQAPSPDDDIA